jgi:hypothetical protein
MEYKHTFAVMAYGESDFLEPCILSILSQSKMSKIIITTATPNDFITAVGDKYNIEVIVNYSAPGIATDWQFAAEACNTPYYTLAHQDDLYYENYTQELLPLMKDSLIAFCNYEEQVGNFTRSKTTMLRIKRMLLWPFIFKQKLKSKWAKKAILCLGSPICCPSVMYNKELCSGLVFSTEYKSDLDWDAWLFLSGKKGAFSCKRKMLMAHRIHEKSETTKLISSHGRLEEDRKIFRKIWFRPIADMLSLFYSRSYKSNNVEG